MLQSSGTQESAVYSLVYGSGVSLGRSRERRVFVLGNET